MFLRLIIKSQKEAVLRSFGRFKLNVRHLKLNASKCTTKLTQNDRPCIDMLQTICFLILRDFRSQGSENNLQLIYITHGLAHYRQHLSFNV